MSATRFIACGMYAFNDDLRQAWQALFGRTLDQLPSAEPVEAEPVVQTGAEILRNPGLLLGPTCG